MKTTSFTSVLYQVFYSKKFPFFLPLLLTITCSLDIPNPLHENYKGDYRLTINWTAALDTIFVLQPCYIRYTSTGSDPFSSFCFSTTPENVIDTQFYRKTFTDSLMGLLFTRSFSGKVRVTGIRPNEKTVTSELDVTVINPYKITGNSVCKIGDTAKLLVNKGSDSYSSQWYADGYDPQKQSASAPCLFSSNTVTSFQVFAIISDTLGNSISTDTVTLSFQPEIPVLKFTNTSINVPVNEEITLTVNITNSDSIIWKIMQLQIDTVTAAPLKISFPEAVADTVIAYSKNLYGTQSIPDTLFVTPVEYSYMLKTVENHFPDTIRAKKWSSWQVMVTEQGEKVTGEQIHYKWEVTPDNTADSTRQSSEGDIIELYLQDSVPPFTLKIQALVGSDSTYMYQQPITVRAFRPSCIFETDDFQTQIHVESAVKVKAEDSNSDGKIAEIYYITDDLTSPEETDGDKSWTIRFSTPGDKTIKSWAVDNDGFISDTAKLQVTVTANKPYFTRTSFDTTVYIKDRFRITMEAFAGNTQDTIKSYKWDFDDNGSIEKVTETSVLDTLFTSAGNKTIRVACFDNRNDTASALIRITVISGKPVVTGITPDSIWMKEAGSFTVHAHDVNGRLTEWAVLYDGDTFEKKSDSIFNHVFTTPGNREIRTFVIDEDGVSSDTIRDSVFVRDGTPIVRAVITDKPLSSIFIRDTVQYIIKGTDPDGFTDSVLGSFNGDTVFEKRVKATGDSAVIKYAFAKSDSGARQIRFRVKDSRGLVRDTLFTVTVRYGAPVIDSLKPLTTWINDDSVYTIYANDTNGNIEKWFQDLDNNGVWDDSSNTSNFTSRFLSAGIKNVRIGILDDDGIITTKIFKADVRSGKPAVWNPQGDTMFVVIPQEGGNINISANSFDTNGTIEQYYWKFNAPFDTVGAFKQSDSVYVNYSVAAPLVNVGFKMAVFCKDDDGLISGDTFFLLPDAPPPTTTTTTTSQPGMPYVRLAWFGLDQRDDSLTQFSVVVGAASNTVNDTIVNFTEAKSIIFGKEGAFITYTFNPQSRGLAGNFYFRIIAMDARGSKPYEINTSIVMYPY